MGFRFDLNGPKVLALPRVCYILKRLDTARTQPDTVLMVAPDIFLVRSKSRPGKAHTVDVRNLTCDCEDWTQQKGREEDEPPRPCWHILKVAEHQRILDAIVSQEL